MEETIKGVQNYRDNNPKILEIPFNSLHKYQASIHSTLKQDNNDRFLVVMKGAPEVIISKCTQILINGETVQIDDEWKAKLSQACIHLGELGERIFGFCDLRLDNKMYPANYSFQIDEADQPNCKLEAMRFLGLISMLDPPRPGVSEAVEKCKTVSRAYTYKEIFFDSKLANWLYF
jgi:sodium/potassium-transporting ATPase subunit alpha